MAGRHDFNKLRARMTPERQERNKKAAKKELRHILLSELRRLAGMTQVQLAAAMGVTQPTVSMLESQDDIRLSTLERIVEALGGKLEVIADLPGERVTLSQFTRQ
jgi:DNA-binding Xre family transcriptional regulator